MIFFYPIGIPILYLVLLLKHGKIIIEPYRDYNPRIQKSSFLWANYKPNIWWFKIFDCVRRLSLSGFVVFFGQGSSSQTVVAMLLCFLSLFLFIHMRPFERNSDNNLSILTQISRFFTLFGALLESFKKR